MRPTSEEISRLLLDVQSGDRAALDTLMPVVYAELRRIAAGFLRNERREHTLQPTALVNEAYLRLAGQSGLHWKSRAHFVGIAAHMMRQVLVDHARRRRAAKRDGALVRVSLDDEAEAEAADGFDLLALDDALRALAERDARLGRLVELRYFGGLSIAETAEVLGVGTATVEREWRMARAWLRRELLGAE
jgi:RNA polymerase sigma-70 factor (ECF subfamily)